jgi:hypothetical protein
MKNRFNLTLFILLILQIGVAASMHHVNNSNANEQFNQPIMDITEAKVDRISLDDGQGQKAILTRVNNQWQLENYFQLPANQSKVKSILDKLENDKSGWPVATTESSRLRFKVADNEFRKKLVIASGKETKTLYLGVSPGFRQLNVRRGGEEQIYSVRLNDYDFPLKDADWMDKTLLQPKADLSSIQAADFKLEKQQGKWQLDGSDGTLDKKQLSTFTSALSQLVVQDAEQKSAEGDIYKISLHAGDKDFQYQLFKSGDNHYIQRNDYPQAFKISAAEYKNLTVASAQQFIKKDGAQDKTSQDAGAQQDGKS